MSFSPATGLVYIPANLAAFPYAAQKDWTASDIGFQTGLDGAMKAAEALQEGRHVGMLVDQYYGRGVPVTFFGRPTNANPLLARLARQVECPIHGVRVVRRPGHRFFVELTPEVPPVRDAQGRIDVPGTMQAVTNVVEGWIREQPAAWLWLHNRWKSRPPGEKPSR